MIKYIFPAILIILQVGAAVDVLLVRCRDC